MTAKSLKARLLHGFGDYIRKKVEENLSIKKSGEVTQKKSSDDKASKQVSSPRELLWKKIKSSNEQVLNSLTYYQRADKLWHLIIYTLPIDLLLLFYIDDSTIPLNNTFSWPLLLVLVFIATAGIFKNSIMDLFSRLRYHVRTHKQSNNYLTLIVILIVGLGTLLEIMVVSGKHLFNSLFLIAFVVLAATPTVIKQVKEVRDHLKILREDSAALLNSVNHQCFLSVIIPIISARFIALVAALTVINGDADIMLYVISALLSLMLLVIQKPEVEQFLIVCKGCAHRVARVLTYRHMCPECAARYHTVNHGTGFTGGKIQKNRLQNLFRFDPQKALLPSLLSRLSLKNSGS
ncbi:MAG: hypothetical protein D6719_12495 [Candidatus Dadabacteria bacterium]|nr:MAG: hypothetical protein D6719_12495 [Candidatus Dadabacteria bacterium]